LGPAAAKSRAARAGRPAPVSAGRPPESAGVRPLAGKPFVAADGTGGRESSLASDLRRRPRRDAGGLRHARAVAGVPRAAGLAGRGFHGPRLAAEAVDSHDRHERRLSAIVAGDTDLAGARSAQRLAGPRPALSRR